MQKLRAATLTASAATGSAEFKLEIAMDFKGISRKSQGKVLREGEFWRILKTRAEGFLKYIF